MMVTLLVPLPKAFEMKKEKKEKDNIASGIQSVREMAMAVDNIRLTLEVTSSPPHPHTITSITPMLLSL
jgi:hypothetical protein